MISHANKDVRSHQIPHADTAHSKTCPRLTWFTPTQFTAAKSKLSEERVVIAGTRALTKSSNQMHPHDGKMKVKSQVYTM